MRPFFTLVLILIITSSISPALATDTMPDTWIATDALGRTISTNDKVGMPRKDKFVGMFYFLWIGSETRGETHDISKILLKDPDAINHPESPFWGSQFVYHYWGEPLFGYYMSDDPWVLRKHAQMLSDAGVDTVIFDVTNNLTYPNVYLQLCKVWTEVRRQGGATPQIAFLAPFGNPRGVVRTLYDSFYSKGMYRDLWFIWKGKPLIMADPNNVDDDVRNFFTFRKPQPSYFIGPTGPNQWGWLEVYPQHVFYDELHRPEQMTVGVGQNGILAKDNWQDTSKPRLAAFTEKDTHGRSWHDGSEDKTPGAVNYGLNAAEQWKRALEVDPEFVFITGWNEWIAMNLPSFNGVSQPPMFVDEFTQEYSRDIEPMKGGHTDNYYYQLVSYIRRYKGAREFPSASEPKTIKIDGGFEDWKNVEPEYRDDVGDTMHRDYEGFDPRVHYINNTGRNDIIASKVARDNEFVYFYVRTHEPITNYDNPNWMLLFINIDESHKTGWEGYDFLVNRKVPDKSTAVLESWHSGWKSQCLVKHAISGSEMEVAVPRAALGLDDPYKPVKFDFKWADNIQSFDPMEFTINGDCAPNWRFDYRYSE